MYWLLDKSEMIGVHDFLSMPKGNNTSHENLVNVDNNSVNVDISTQKGKKRKKKVIKNIKEFLK